MALDSPDPADGKLIETIQRRHGRLTTVVLNDGTELVVKDITWGYDIGDEYAHITTNISPGAEGLSVDFFYSDAVLGLRDTATGEVILLGLD